MAKTITSLCLLITFFWQTTTLPARDLFPLEMLYVQTDKQNYFTGETIWFRAYLINTETNRQDTLSRYVYAELINSQREVMDRVKIRHENGVFAGHILVTENLEAGSYILRFFTRHLENFGEEFFFTRLIHIITPQSLESPQSPESPPVPSQDFSVSFHPEGGDIPVGVYTRIAFKAINSSGLGEDIQGVIVNESGDTITHFQSAHLGMGSFMLRTDRDDRFFAIAQNAAGIERRVELPRAKEDAISLQILRNYEDIDIVAHLPEHNNSVFYLTLQHRGRVIHSERWDNNYQVAFTSEDELPTGVIGIILSDERGVPLSKRQIFNINPTEIVNTTFITDRETYGTRERVNATVSIADEQNRPLNANFSISVIDNDIAHYDASVNILSTLLLSSNLRGHIENPAYYFISENENAEEHLDLVMLTHGWSRFNVSSVYQEETFVFERSQTITGALQGSLRRIANQPVNLLVPELLFFDMVYTDHTGRFRFENFEAPEGTEFFIQGSRNTEILIDEVAFPAVNQFFIPARRNNVFFADEQREEIRRFMQIDDDIWSMYLEELVVTERRPEVRNPNRPIWSSPFNNRVEGEILEHLRLIAVNLFDLVILANPRIERFTIGGSAALEFRDRPRSPNSPSRLEPLVFVNNMLFDPTHLHGPGTAVLQSFPVHNIESIEFAITMAQTAIFGTRGINGVIMITTDNTIPLREIRHTTVVTPLGYQITREFFAPAYTTDAQRQNPNTDLRTTIYWNPSVTTREDGIAHLHFYTSDHVGNYVVVIEGITDDGRIVHTMGRIQ